MKEYCTVYFDRNCGSKVIRKFGIPFWRAFAFGFTPNGKGSQYILRMKKNIYKKEINIIKSICPSTIIYISAEDELEYCMYSFEDHDYWEAIYNELSN